MKAFTYTRYGPPEVLQLSEVATPTPRDNEILVRVRASTVTSGTIWARSGRHPSPVLSLALRVAFGIRRPRKQILGYELAGDVEAVGGGVTRFQQGDRVYGTTTGLAAGAYAEYVCVPEVWRQGVVAKMPAEISYAEAAAAPIGAMTAMHLLGDAVGDGQRVLVYGASGSVGSYAVQLAMAAGAAVTAVCGPAHVDLVRSLGVADIIDYTAGDFTQHGGEYDLVFDAVGKIARSQVAGLIASNGGYRSVKTPTSEKSEYLARLNGLLPSGDVRALIDRTYPLLEVAEAHRYVELGHKGGNVVIEVGST